MEFDEIEYLEKTVEEAEDRDDSRKRNSSSKKRDGIERSYRKREVDDEVVDNDEVRKVKKSKAEDENDRDRHRRDRDLDRDRSSREKDRDRERSSHREKEKERERREKEKERERREREREIEVERDRRERSRSRSKRYESDSREREKEREIDTRESRKFKEKKEAVEPEADPERDQRTVFVYQMPLKATERDVYEFFSKAGKVRDVRLIMDRNSRRSKGVGYVEFYDAMSVPMAIALSGQLLFGQPVMVKPSEAEKNLVQSSASGGGTGGVAGPFGPVDRKLYVGNLHFNMTEMQLRQAASNRRIMYRLVHLC